MYGTEETESAEYLKIRTHCVHKLEISNHFCYRLQSTRKLCCQPNQNAFARSFLASLFITMPAIKHSYCGLVILQRTPNNQQKGLSLTAWPPHVAPLMFPC